MTVNEFSNQFDAMVQAFLMKLPFGTDRTFYEFDEYEKSVFLTEALKTFVLNYYSNNGTSYETSEEVRRYLNELVVTSHPLKYQNPTFTVATGKTHTVYRLPQNCWFIVYEEAKLQGSGACANITVEILPIPHDNFYRTCRNPFRGPSERRVLRLDSGGNTVELVSQNPITDYLIRYIKQPSPIILCDLEGLEIDNEDRASECMLHPALHHRILEMAVQLAMASRSKTTNNK